MPFPREFRHGCYGKRLHALRMRVFARADHKCEECRVPDDQQVRRGPMNSWQNGACWYSPDGMPPGKWPETRTVLIRLTVAQLNRVVGDHRDENFKALCQWCRRNYPKLHPEETRGEREDTRAPLMAPVAVSA